eukprot:gene6911-8558_t
MVDFCRDNQLPRVSIEKFSDSILDFFLGDDIAMTYEHVFYDVRTSPGDRMGGALQKLARKHCSATWKYFRTRQGFLQSQGFKALTLKVMRYSQY